MATFGKMYCCQKILSTVLAAVHVTLQARVPAEDCGTAEQQYYSGTSPELKSLTLRLKAPSQPQASHAASAP